ncbi:aminodeoxychorismate synthase component I [Microbacterium sp. ZW T5_45]|uniref:aminodeoxychorismate synthase component I n=1 Tax=Microbacterium sp. ZW T5_45 TaxID=3378080 RepID=UPI0038539233
MPEPLTTRALDAARLPNGGLDTTALFLALAGSFEDVFWLDAGSDAAKGWSFLGTGVRDAAPRDVRLDTTDHGGIPFTGAIPFSGGWVGWFDYETGAGRAGAPTAPADGGAWLRTTRIAAIEHSTGRVWALAADDELEEWAAFVAEPRAAASVEPIGITEDADARHTPAQYRELIERCRDHIRAGAAYQLCLTTRFTVPGEHDPVAAYLRLRSETPAHHGGFLRIGGRALLSASPEQFLDVRGSAVRTKPIKGTRPRGADTETDAALAAELVADEKERAENVMIVDLMRNDLSRVCVPGSIRVDALWQVESYPAVHQLVSTVSGTVAPGTTLADLLEAAFPAGSMTGAPKLSAMTLLHDLEGGPRGIYAGCFGYVGANGALDLAMVIRSIVVDADQAVVGAGGGITWRSIAAAETAEVAIKARAPLAALGARTPALWRSDILN